MVNVPKGVLVPQRGWPKDHNNRDPRFAFGSEYQRRLERPSAPAVKGPRKRHTVVSSGNRYLAGACFGRPCSPIDGMPIDAGANSIALPRVGSYIVCVLDVFREP